jgi:hypothetical protein
MATIFNQFGNVSIDNESVGIVTNSSISFDRISNKVFANIICFCNFNDKSSIFKFFIDQNEAGVILEFQNPNDPDNPQRTISLNSAVCKDYIESFSMGQQTLEGSSDFLISFIIEAKSASMGEVDFPK